MGANCCKRGQEVKFKQVRQEETNEEAEALLITEKAMDKLVHRVVANLSWVNAALFAHACVELLELGKWFSKHGIARAWIYFLSVWTVTILAAWLPRAFEDPDEVARELELTVPDKLSKIDEETRNLIQKRIDKAKHRKVHSGSKGKSKRLGDILIETFEDLLISTMSIVCAMTMRDAIKYTLYGEDGKSTIADIAYALVITFFGIWLTVKLGGIHDKLENKIYKDIKEQGLDEAKDEMLVFALQKRLIKLATFVIGLGMAWAWRDAIKALILQMFPDSLHLMGYWLYALTATGIIGVIFTFNAQFFFLYPRNETVPYLQPDSKSRLLLGNVLHANLQVVTGMAWIDAIDKTLLKKYPNKGSGFISWYWATVVFCMVGSVILEFYYDKFLMHIDMMRVGVVHFFSKQFDNIHDPNKVLEEDHDEKKTAEKLRNDFWHVTFEELCKLLFVAWGVCGGLGVRNASSATINNLAAKSYSDDKEFEEHPLSKEHREIVGYSWMIVFICILISTIIVAYFGRTINSIKKERRKLFKELEKETKDLRKKDTDESSYSSESSDDNIRGRDKQKLVEYLKKEKEEKEEKKDESIKIDIEKEKEEEKEEKKEPTKFVDDDPEVAVETIGTNEMTQKQLEKQEIELSKAPDRPENQNLDVDSNLAIETLATNEMPQQQTSKTKDDKDEQSKDETSEVVNESIGSSDENN